MTKPSVLICNESEAAEVLECFRSAADNYEPIVKRFVVHWHVHELPVLESPLRAVGSYFAQLGMAPDRAGVLREIAVPAAYSIIGELLRYDLAREEELVSAEQAERCRNLVEQKSSDWAAYAFTNLSPLRVPGRLSVTFSPRTRVVRELDMEGGVILLGEQDIAMIWFLEDDSPSRGMLDLRYR